MKESHTKDKGDIGLDREGLARGGISLRMKWYYLNIYFTYAQSAQSQVQLVLIVTASVRIGICCEIFCGLIYFTAVITAL